MLRIRGSNNPVNFVDSPSIMFSQPTQPVNFTVEKLIQNPVLETVSHPVGSVPLYSNQIGTEPFIETNNKSFFLKVKKSKPPKQITVEDLEVMSAPIVRTPVQFVFDQGIRPGLPRPLNSIP